MLNVLLLVQGIYRDIEFSAVPLKTMQPLVGIRGKLEIYYFKATGRNLKIIM